MGDSLAPPAKAPKKKKALAFLKSTPKPAAVSTHNDGNIGEEDDDLAMFQRSRSFFPIVVKEQEEAREVTPEPETEQGRRGTYDEDDGPLPSSARSAKRRKLSTPPSHVVKPFRESSEDLYGPATPPQGVSESPTASPSRSTRAKSSVWKGKDKEALDLVKSDILPTPSRSNSHQPADGVVALEDEDDPFREEGAGGDTRSSKRTRGASTPIQREGHTPVAIELADSDDEIFVPAPEPVEDEFAHFVKRAEEREAAARAAEASQYLSDGDHDGTGPRKRAPVTAVKIFIASRLDGMEVPKPFGSMRGINQDLGTVRRAFCQWLRNQGLQLSEDMERNVFLTWKGRRIYDSSSGATLGWQPHALSGFRGSCHQPGFTRGGILLEAWTDEAFERHQAEQERQKLVDRGELIDDGAATDDDGAAAGEQEEQELPKLRLLLKEKNRDPLRLTVWADTAIKILAGAYRKQRNVPADREIKLQFDGEWLSPGTAVQDTDVEDMDTIEVYLK